MLEKDCSKRITSDVLLPILENLMDNLNIMEQ